MHRSECVQSPAKTAGLCKIQQRPIWALCDMVAKIAGKHQEVGFDCGQILARNDGHARMEEMESVAASGEYESRATGNGDREPRSTRIPFPSNPSRPDKCKSPHFISFSA